MKNKMSIVIVVGVFFFLTLISGAALSEKAPGIITEEFGWELTNAKVVNPGKAINIKEGTLITGYEIEAIAIAIGKAPISKGVFQITYSIFSPKHNMPGQKAGNWYLDGSWAISNSKENLNKKLRHDPDVFRGRLNAELSFNPIASCGMIDALIPLPRSLTAGRWRAGGGTFSGNQMFEGIISLRVGLWPDVKKGGQS